MLSINRLHSPFFALHFSQPSYRRGWGAGILWVSSQLTDHTTPFPCSWWAFLAKPSGPELTPCLATECQHHLSGEAFSTLWISLPGKGSHNIYIPIKSHRNLHLTNHDWTEWNWIKSRLSLKITLWADLGSDGLRLKLGGWSKRVLKSKGVSLFQGAGLQLILENLSSITFSLQIEWQSNVLYPEVY